MRLHILVVFIFTLLTFGCGGGGETNSGSSGSGSRTSLEGTWIKDCGPSSIIANDINGRLDIYEIVKLKFTGNSLIVDVDNYTDNLCSINNSPFIPSHTTTNINFSIGEKIITTGGIEANKIDFTVISGSNSQGQQSGSVELKTYGIFYINNDSLFFSKEAASLSPESRPKTLDFDKAFIFQQ